MPEPTIRRHVSEIKLNGAENPAKLFNYRMRRYAEGHLAKAHAGKIADFKKTWSSKHSPSST